MRRPTREDLSAVGRALGGAALAGTIVLDVMAPSFIDRLRELPRALWNRRPIILPYNVAVTIARAIPHEQLVALQHRVVNLSPVKLYNDVGETSDLARRTVAFVRRFNPR